MNTRLLTLVFTVLGLLPASLVATPAILSETLYTELDWSHVETTEEGITIAEKAISGIAVKAVKVSAVIELDPEILAQVIEDVSNYGRFLTSASAMECDLLELSENGLVGYQYVDIPMISDRVYAFRMARPLGDASRVDWELLPRESLADYEVNEREGVYLDYGVGSWSMIARTDGKYDVSYRLVMDPGGWIPDSISDYFNRVSIVGIFKDALVETERRTSRGNG